MNTSGETGGARFVRLLDGLLSPLENLFNFLAALSILTLMLLAVCQVIGRSVLNMPIPGFIDFVEQAMALFAFLGIAYCQREGGHIRMELLVSRFKGTKALWVIEAFLTALTLVLIVALVYGSYLHFERAINLGDSTIDIGLPTWPSKIVVPIALSLLVLRLLTQLLGFLRLCHQPEATPVGVPLIKDVVETAQHEIDDVSGAEETSEAKR